MNDYYRLSMREAISRMRTGAMSCVDYVASHLQRIESMENSLGAWAWLDPAHAISHAKLLDTRGELSNHTLHGIPIGIKDVIETLGIPTTMGSDVFKDHVSTQTATVVHKLEQAGAFVMGKTVTAEFAFLAPGKTRNPWNEAHTPGGSSSGSAAAVAAGFVPAALGTQTNGSVIRPAAYCGVVGFKPSQGLISNEGTLDYAPSLDQIGWFTRDVGDAAWLASSLIPVAQKLVPLEHACRLAAIRSPVWNLVQLEQGNQYEHDLTALRAAGAEVVETELPQAFERAHRIHRCIMAYETARYFQELRETHRHLISIVLNRFIDEGREISGTAYNDALKLRGDLRQQLTRFFTGFDAIITPPATGEAPATLEHTGDPSFCSVWTLCGVPAICIPTGLGPQGLPLGLQIVGAQFKDERLLEFAGWCETTFAFKGLLSRAKTA